MHTRIYMSSAHKLVGTNRGLHRITVERDTAAVIVGILDFRTEASVPFQLRCLHLNARGCSGCAVLM